MPMSLSVCKMRGGRTRLKACYLLYAYKKAYVAHMLLLNASLGSVYASSARCSDVGGLPANCPNTMDWRAGCGSHKTDTQPQSDQPEWKTVSSRLGSISSIQCFYYEIQL